MVIIDTYLPPQQNVISIPFALRISQSTTANQKLLQVTKFNSPFYLLSSHEPTIHSCCLSSVIIGKTMNNKKAGGKLNHHWQGANSYPIRRCRVYNPVRGLGHLKLRKQLPAADGVMCFCIVILCLCDIRSVFYLALHSSILE